MARGEAEGLVVFGAAGGVGEYGVCGGHGCVGLCGGWGGVCVGMVGFRESVEFPGEGVFSMLANGLGQQVLRLVSD